MKQNKINWKSKLRLDFEISYNKLNLFAISLPRFTSIASILGTISGMLITTVADRAI